MQRLFKGGGYLFTVSCRGGVYLRAATNQVIMVVHVIILHVIVLAN